MAIYKRQPSHPGLFLKHVKLQNKNLDEFSIASKIKRSLLDKFIKGEIDCDVEIASKLALHFKTSEAFWLNMQIKLNVWKLNKNKNRK